MTPEWVVDASVAIKLFVAEDLSEEASLLFEGLWQDPPVQFYVPDLFYLECASILWKYVRRFGHSPEKARAALQDLDAMDLRPAPSSILFQDSLDLALLRDTSVYDASYVCLAQSLRIPFVTADRKLVVKLQGSGIRVHWLGEPGLL